MLYRLYFIILLVLTINCASKKKVAPFYENPPKSEEKTDWIPPSPKLYTLKNNLKVYNFHKNSLPLIHTRLIIRSGSARDAQNKYGLAGFVGEMLKSGTKNYTSKEINEIVETLGSYLSVHVDKDTTTLSFTCLKENFDDIFHVFAEIVLNPTFPQKEIEKMRKQRLNSLIIAQDNPKYLASTTFDKVIFGDHPYAHSILGSATSIKQINKKDLIHFHTNHYKSNNAAIIITGDISFEDSIKKVEKYFGKWIPQTKKLDTFKKVDTFFPGFSLVHKEDAPQSQLRIGHISFHHKHSDYFAFHLLNTILGGMFNSRINMNLREDKGYTYGARSSHRFNIAQGVFVIGTGVRTDVTIESIKEIFKEIKIIQTEPVSERELQNAKNKYTLSLPGYFQNLNHIANSIRSIYIYDLPLDYYQTLSQKINEITLQDVQRVAQKHLKRDKLSFIVVGDKKKVEKDLDLLKQKLGFKTQSK